MLLDFILHGDIYFIIEISPGHEKKKKKKKRGGIAAQYEVKNKSFFIFLLFLSY
jgi:hypothetical protein